MPDRLRLFQRALYPVLLGTLRIEKIRKGLNRAKAKKTGDLDEGYQ
jgi:hypothetical protein